MGPHDQDDEEKNQSDDFTVRTAEKHHAHCFGEAEDDAAGKAAEERTEAGENDDDQCFQRPLQTDGWTDRVGNADESSRNSGERGAEGKGRSTAPA